MLLVTGIDEYGDLIHGSTYQQLWNNLPKECNEYPDFTFDEYFQKPAPSYLPQHITLNYLEGLRNLPCIILYW